MSGAGAATTIRVALGERAYDVLIGPGLAAQAAGLIAARLGAGKCGIVTDAHVAACQLGAVESGLKAAGRHAGTLRPALHDHGRVTT